MRRKRAIAAVVAVAAIGCAPIAAADPGDQLCRVQSYRDLHKSQCDFPNRTGAPGALPGGGGPGSGGLLGIIHRLTGGLL